MPTTLSPADIKRLQSLQSFEDLVNYLRDDLDWPLDDIEIEDLTFEYSPKELGLQQQYVVKLRSVKQLRPLVTHQPWGIFYLEFEPKKLPVVVLRRILKELVPKKRASLNQGDHALWNKHDLLFISAMGEETERRISFAHFRDLPDGRTGLDTFDWDDHETQFAGIGLSLDKLHWPTHVSDIGAWRMQWASAFTRPHGYVVQSAEQLSRALAELARRTRDRVQDIYLVEQPDGPLHKLFEAFKTALVHDLTSTRFADMVAQTVAYGLFAARAERGDTLRLSHLAEMIPATNPFLRELFSEIETLADDPDSFLSFDELGVSDIVALLNAKNITAIVEDFGRQTGGGREDPVIHFYESFLKDYDSAQRVQRGVFYTPQPVVSFIVRSVDHILRDEFSLPDGLADTTTWGEMQARYPDLKLPKGVSPDAPFVQILDPATGTGTFLVEVIDLIWRTMMAKWEKERKTKTEIHALWNAYVPAHLLPRLNGFELMMASYAIAHVKLGLKLRQTGYEFGSGERLRVFLTNTLEEPDELGKQKTMASAFNFLAHESRDADTVKRDTPITVVVGNPPYSGESLNNSGWITELLHTDLPDAAGSYYEYNHKSLGERNTKWLNDDYVKFFRVAQYLIARTGGGVLGFISNNGYLDNPTFRGMRQSLLTTFADMHLLDLHGNANKRERDPAGGEDHNVFDIRQGVAIGLLTKPITKSEASVRQANLYGVREFKYQILLDQSLKTLNFTSFIPENDSSLFKIQTSDLRAEYRLGWKVTEAFPTNSVGIVTARDALTIQWSSEEIWRVVTDFISLTPEAARSKYNLGEDARDWKVAMAQADLVKSGPSKLQVIPILYRPFDQRFTYYTGVSRGFQCMPRPEVMQNMLVGRNLALNITRQTKADHWHHAIVSNKPTPAAFVEIKDNCNLFPLYVYTDSNRRRANMSKEFVVGMEKTTGLKLSRKSETVSLASTPIPILPPILGMFSEFHGVFNADLALSEDITPVDMETFTPEEIFHYAYAIFHSPTYCERYAEFLKIDFPRLPLTSDVPLFRALAALGEQLTALHLMERVGPNPAGFPVTGSNSVDAAPRYDEITKRVYISKAQYFAPVPPEVWEFHIGGYKVCHKWLKDRKGRTLTDDDITHYGKIVAALGETIRLMGEIDAVIEEHGGWPLK